MQHRLSGAEEVALGVHQTVVLDGVEAVAIQAVRARTGWTRT